MSAIGIHPAGIAFADILARLHAACFAEPWSNRAIAELLAMPGGFALLASSPASDPGNVGEPLGFLLGRAVAGECEVLTIAVRPDSRRRGAGRALLDAALVHARAAGIRLVFLEVAEDNHAARQLYAGLGFEIVGRRKHYYRGAPGSPRDALQLRLELTSH